MPWTAVFDDGPLAAPDKDRVFSVGPIWQRIVLVQLPRDPRQPMNPWASHWAIVAGDGIGELETERVLWDGEVTYRLGAVDAPTRTCPLCGGDGGDLDDSTKDCDECDGVGRVHGDPVAHYAVAR